jgi:hypothetical protein
MSAKSRFHLCYMQFPAETTENWVSGVVLYVIYRQGTISAIDHEEMDMVFSRSTTTSK